MWIALAISSAFLLGIYDIFKKLSLKDNSVLHVIFISSIVHATLFVPVVIINAIYPELLEGSIFSFHFPSLYKHGLYLLKAIIVTASWTFAYLALKHLPITIVTPIRATAPVWTLLGALFILHEQLAFYQWVGVIVIFISYYFFSLAGVKEGIKFTTNKWVLCVFAATLLGAASGLFDKYLISNFNRIEVQSWFALYLVVVQFFLLRIFQKNSIIVSRFHWNKFIPLIGLSLAFADFFYFYALSFPDALISLISPIRRSSVIVSFIIGSRIFHEVNLRRKSVILVGIIGGIAFIVAGS